jgi:Delta14-sterol reductase
MTAAPAPVLARAIAFAAPLAIYAAILALHVALPARWVDGYVTGADGARLRYRLNGLLVFVVVVAAWFAVCARGWLAWDALWTWRWEAAAGACAVGLAFTFAIVLPARARGGFVADLYLGRLDNPRTGGGRVDAKMVLYLAGATMLELLELSFAAHHVLAHPRDPSPGVLLHVVLFTFFVAEYLTFEEVHLYTYDFFAERVGFKLGWGCLVFYPFFYAAGLWSVADRPNPHAPRALEAAAVALFFVGWMLSRGANLQKFAFKTRPGAKFLGVVAPRAIEGDGRRLLCSGFWRVSRHVNYLGEIAMACGLALSLGWPAAIGPWTYPLYYVALLVPRQLADDRRCAAKYGALWAEYSRAVPYRIVPWVY